MTCGQIYWACPQALTRNHSCGRTAGTSPTRRRSSTCALSSPSTSFRRFQLTLLHFNSTSPPLDLKSFDCKLPSPHFNAFIDLDGDCLADLFLTCEGKSAEHLSYQIWLNNKDGNFTLARKGDLPRGTKSVSFADMGEFDLVSALALPTHSPSSSDRDGTIDMVITSCSSTGACDLSIAYNQQIPLCTSAQSQTEPCRDPEALCVADKDFSFDFSSKEGNSVGP